MRVQVNMNAEDMDTFVFCIANKKTAAKMAKEMADITTFCPERRSAIPDKVLNSRNHMEKRAGVVLTAGGVNGK